MQQSKNDKQCIYIQQYLVELRHRTFDRNCWSWTTLFFVGISKFGRKFLNKRPWNVVYINIQNCDMFDMMHKKQLFFRVNCIFSEFCVCFRDQFRIQPVEWVRSNLFVKWFVIWRGPKVYFFGYFTLRDIIIHWELNIVNVVKMLVLVSTNWSWQLNLKFGSSHRLQHHFNSIRNHYFKIELWL